MLFLPNINLWNLKISYVHEASRHYPKDSKNLSKSLPFYCIVIVKCCYSTFHCNVYAEFEFNYNYMIYQSLLMKNSS